jgi:hypothetical protein
MFKILRKNPLVTGIISLFILFTLLWLYIQISGTKNEKILSDIFTLTYGFIALFGSVLGLKISNKWGGKKSIMGNATLLFSLGLLAQEFGQLSYAFYIYILKINVPYPSIGDIGYFGSIPCYIAGIIMLGKASGTHIGLHSFKNKLQAIFIPLFMLFAGFYLFLSNYQFDWSNPIAILLDFGYPLGEAIYISIAILVYLLSRNVLGGIMKNKILFLIFALTVQFVADYMFLYQVKNNAWSVSGINDYIYLVSYTLMSLGLLQFNLKSNMSNPNKPE